MRGAVFIILAAMSLTTAAQAQPAGTSATQTCKPCWIEPWLCKAPPCVAPDHPLPPAPPPSPPRDGPARPRLVHRIITGVVTHYGVVQEEPAQTPQATLYLRPQGSPRRSRGFLVVLPAYRFGCGEGDIATMEGDDEPAANGFPEMLVDARLLSCNSPPPSR
jgi:hypothetical protein